MKRFELAVGKAKRTRQLVKFLRSGFKPPGQIYGVIDNRTHLVYPFRTRKAAEETLKRAVECPRFIQLFLSRSMPGTGDFRFEALKPSEAGQ